MQPAYHQTPSICNWLQLTSFRSKACTVRCIEQSGGRILEVRSNQQSVSNNVFNRISKFNTRAGFFKSHLHAMPHQAQELHATIQTPQGARDIPIIGDPKGTKNFVEIGACWQFIAKLC